MDFNLTIRDRLVALMSAQNVKAVTVAQACGVSPQAVVNWRRTGKIDRRHFPQLSALFNVPLDYWLGGPAVKPVRVHAYEIQGIDGVDGVDGDREVVLPVYDIEVSGGPGVVVPDFVETKYRLSYQMDWLNRWNAKPEDILIARVQGGSMEPTLYDGDKVVIHQQRKDVRNDRVYSLICGGEARVKRLFRQADGSLRIVSDNRDKDRYPDEYVGVSDMSSVYIIGQVIERMGSGGL
jgi:hypothetical protein